MYIRIVKGYGNRYMQVVESYRQDSKNKQHVLWSLGIYDIDLYQQAKQNISDWKKLKRSAIVLDELSNAIGPPQGKGYFKAFQNHY
jgi:hypothetical protein